MWPVFFAIIYLAGHTFAGETCCPRIGCFNVTSGHPMGHLDDPDCPEDIGVKFILINQKTNGLEEEFDHDTVPEEFDPSKMTVFTIHGWKGKATTGWMDDMAHKLPKKFDANVILVDWYKGAQESYYPKSASNTQTVGAHVAAMMDGLNKDFGVDFDNMWCIGFSLGAHVCGHAGMRTGGKLARVTGLDPAGPLFEGMNPLNGINPTSAQFVDCIHTDGYGWFVQMGTLEPRGHVDFYPNGGKNQPGCSMIAYEDLGPVGGLLACGHFRAPYLWLDSLRYQRCFISRKKCKDSKDMPGSCEEVEGVVMGAFADPATPKGIYYLETRNNEPYCKF